MSILVDKKTRLVVQGITGGEGSFHTQQIKDYGTNVVAGVTPGKGGTYLRTKMKNLISGRILEETFRSAEKFEFFAASRLILLLLFF